MVTFTCDVRAEPFDRLIVLEASSTSETQCIVAQIYEMDIFHFRKYDSFCVVVGK